MVEYSVDTNPRLRVYFGAAAASLAGAYALSAVPSLAPYRFAAPSAFVIFGVLLWLFDRYLWRLPLVRTLVGIPYLGGTWEGRLTRINSVADMAPEVHDVKCHVTQTWRKIDFVFEGHTSVSSARIVGLFVENPDHVVVRYVYALRPKTLLQPSNLSGEGVTELRFLQQSDGEYLKGIYYSDKPRRGDILLKRVDARRAAKPNTRLEPAAPMAP